VAVDAHLTIVEETSVDAPSGPLHGAVDGSRIERVSPNPFRSSTSIRCVLAHDRQVRVSIVDPAGRRVRRLHDGARASGTFDVSWDGRDDSGARVATGLYFVELAAGTERSTERVLLLR
jgi:hypothetical protein